MEPISNPHSIIESLLTRKKKFRLMISAGIPRDQKDEGNLTRINEIYKIIKQLEEGSDHQHLQPPIYQLSLAALVYPQPLLRTVPLLQLTPSPFKPGLLRSSFQDPSNLPF